MVNMSMIQKR